MTVLPAVKQEEVNAMATEAQIVMNGGRISQINVFPSGECMQEAFHCECITHDFLGRERPVGYWFYDGRILFSCESGLFSFEISNCADDLKKIEEQISRGGFTFAKKGDGFSLIA